MIRLPGVSFLLLCALRAITRKTKKPLDPRMREDDGVGDGRRWRVWFDVYGPPCFVLRRLTFLPNHIAAPIKGGRYFELITSTVRASASTPTFPLRHAFGVSPVVSPSFFARRKC